MLFGGLMWRERSGSCAAGADEAAAAAAAAGSMKIPSKGIFQ